MWAGNVGPDAENKAPGGGVIRETGVNGVDVNFPSFLSEQSDLFGKPRLLWSVTGM